MASVIVYTEFTKKPLSPELCPVPLWQCPVFPRLHSLIWEREPSPGHRRDLEGRDERKKGKVKKERTRFCAGTFFPLLAPVPVI